MTCGYKRKESIYLLALALFAASQGKEAMTTHFMHL
jgi:hypothetical protein